ncbi:MAG TPA: EamA/RhaT family transporter [Gemmatimonas aurantiaca]|uniref:EamA/RhaT family transporter n=1 Tax=Gemmatimonas aurantiaca TaxID=173480 RepID=A0A3D4VAV7_9BACT|nr:DMT family transporter [Gemmatimonas aurantiaca]HCT58243.1 EamA/RhaT family transporter [Gemmatimonas aurantiaca]
MSGVAERVDVPEARGGHDREAHQREAHDRASRLKGTLAVIVSACCFGSISPLTVIATGQGMALESVQTWRYLTTATLLVLWGLIRRDTPAPASTDVWQSSSAMVPWYAPRILFQAGVGQASVATLALLALRWLPAATASFLFYTYPAWVAVFAAVRGTDHLDRTRVIALVLSLLGLGAMVGAPSAESLAPMGVMVILAAAIVYALYIPLLARLQTGRDPLDVARAIAVGGSVCFLTWSLSSGAFLSMPTPVGLFASVTQGVISAGAFLGFLLGLRLLGSVRTAITSTVEPFWTTLLGITLLGQGVGIGTVVGGIAIMGAVLLLQRPPALPRVPE